MSTERETGAPSIGRRRMVKRLLVLAAGVPATLTATAFACDRSPHRAEGKVGGPCDGCEIIYDGMPGRLSSETTLVAAGEPGEPMVISGTIFEADAKTPASGVILYVYHTDARGLYAPVPNQPGASARHGHIRGWMKTDAQGRYRFTSIRPAPYPGREVPAHIHPIVIEPGKNEYYIDEYRFDDDPLLTASERSKQEGRGGSGIIHLVRVAGVWTGTRDIVLGRNVPDYR